MSTKQKKIAVLTSGGDAPGMNAAVRAVVRSAVFNDIECYGVYKGYEGLISDKLVKLNARGVNNIVNKGGTILKSARCNEFRTKEGRIKAKSTLDKYEIDSLVVIGVPTNDFKQEPASNSDIKDFCEKNFNINFPMTEKVNVLGKDAHPFYKWAKENFGNGAIPKWNFHKIIIGKNGKVADTFASITNPSSKKFVSFIEDQIKN